MVEGKRIVTASAGFIGSTLAGRLLAKDQIVASDNLARNALHGHAYAYEANLRKGIQYVYYRVSQDVELRVPFVCKGKGLLGLEAKVDFEKGIRKTAEYYQTVNK